MSRLTLRQLASDTNWSIDFTDRAAEMLEYRITDLEAIVAARWPRSVLVRYRLARQLRASVRGYRRVGPGFRSRRIEAADISR